MFILKCLQRYYHHRKNVIFGDTTLSQIRPIVCNLLLCPCVHDARLSKMSFHEAKNCFFMYIHKYVI